MYIAVCPRGYERIFLNYDTLDTDFTVVGLGPFGASDAFGEPVENVEDAVLNSNTSVILTEEDKIIVKPRCPDAEIREVSFTVSGATSGVIYYLSNEGVVVEEEEV